MRTVNLAALALIVCGAGVLARPKPASATYRSPWGNSFGITYCCKSTGGAAESSCCSITGCVTSGGFCASIG